MKRENTYESDNESSCYHEEQGYYLETMKNESQPQHQQQQEEQHPYSMSIYQPLLFATEPAKVVSCPSTSQQQRRPDKTSSSSSVADQSPPSRRINATIVTTVSIRAKKRRKITTAASATTTTAAKFDYTDNNVAENGVQVEVHEDETRMNFNEQVAHIVKTFLDDSDADADIDIDEDDDDDDGHDSITDGRINNNNNNNNNGDYDYSSDSSNNEAIIERMKLVTKTNKQINSKPQPASGVTATAHSIGDKRNGNCTDSGIKYVTIRNNNTKYRDERWEEMYQQLVAYKKEHKDTNVPRSYKKDPKLGAWVNNQRATYRHKKMTEERKRLLNSIGFAWVALSPGTVHKSATWEEMYQRLVAYKTEHKDTMVPQNNKKYPQLGSWVNTQRSTYRNKKMTEERKRLLNSIGFVWNTLSPGTVRKSGIWEEMYQRLVAYKKEHKDTKVPQSYKKDPQLGAWVRTQRMVNKKKKMTEERKRLLNSIGFAWVALSPGTIAAIWEEMHQRLVAYKKEHKNTNVPNMYKKDPQLGRWVKGQRASYRNKKMTEEHKRLLDSIGFVWNAHLPGTVRNSAAWEATYRRLVAYKMEHKDTNVPRRYKKDPQLGTWVYTQRVTHKKKEMTEERNRLLDSIGFVWNTFHQEPV